jgi:tRNA threonylcarbamoyladenosine biosynthesis protein TsaB
VAVILNIETATRACSVALSYDDSQIKVREALDKNSHSATITLFIEEVMKTAGVSFADLDAVAVSMGPGSYTGLRIGVSTAKGICYATDKPLIAINTLQAMAAGMVNEMESRLNETPSRSTLYCPMIDARRMEVYNALYDSGFNIIRETQAEIIDENSFRDLLEKYVIVFAGDGAEKCKPMLGLQPNARFMDDFFPSAAFMVRLAEKKFHAGDFENVAYFEPFYLKDFIPGVPRVKGLV